MAKAPPFTFGKNAGALPPPMKKPAAAKAAPPMPPPTMDMTPITAPPLGKKPGPAESMFLAGKFDKPKAPPPPAKPMGKGPAKSMGGARGSRGY